LSVNFLAPAAFWFAATLPLAAPSPDLFRLAKHTGGKGAYIAVRR
jgi:hypothetical protein